MNVRPLVNLSTSDLSPYLSGAMAEAACYLLQQDVYDLEGDHALMTALNDLLPSIHILALKCGISNDPLLGKVRSRSQHDTDSSSYQSLSFLLRSSLSLAVSYQCRALDQALLLTAVRNGSLLRHLNRIEDTCIISPRSSFISLLVTAVIESHIYRFPRCGTINPKKLDRSYLASQHRLVWTSRALDSAAKKVKSSMSMDASDYTLLYAIDSSKISDTDLSNRKSFSIFSSFELDFLHIEYSAPWPLSIIFSPSNLAPMICCSKRLFRIVHASHMSSLIWGDIKDFRAHIPKSRNQESDSLRKMVNEVYWKYHCIHKIIKSLGNFFCDRVLAAQEDFRIKVIKSSADGFATIVRLFQAYSRNLSSTTFSDRNYKGKYVTHFP